MQNKGKKPTANKGGRKFQRGRNVNIREDVDNKGSSAKESPNDPSWYIVNGQLAKDVASYSFNNPVGKPIVLSSESNILSSGSLSSPGIFAIQTVPLPGYSRDGSSAVNLAAKNFYSFIRHQNSGHSNYDSPDLMMYLLAMDSVYAFYAYMLRAYGVIRTYSQVNRYVCDALLNSMGLNATNLRMNLANFRAYINMYVTKASAFATPATMSLYKRHMWMYSLIYQDAPNFKSQFYLYNPAYLYVWDETTSDHGFLQPKGLTCSSTLTNGQIVPSNYKGFTDLVGFGEELLAKIVASEDFNIMSGDILKAYGKENIYMLSTVPEDYTILPIYSEEILSQIHNTCFTGANIKNLWDGASEPVAGLGSLVVEQNTSIGEGAIICTPTFDRSPGLDFQRVVDMFSDNPTPEEVLVATRNTIANSCIAHVAGQNTYYICIPDFASDLPLFASIFYFKPEDGDTLLQTLMFTSLGNDYSGYLNSHLLSKFNGHPLGYQVANDSMVGIVGDLNNYTVLGRYDIRKMHESAILSMLSVPLLGVANKSNN